MNKIDHALMLCVSKDETRSQWIQKPFYIDDKVISTDAHVMLIAKKNDNEHEYSFCESPNPENVLYIIPKTRIEPKLVLTAEIRKEIMDEVPMIDEIKEITAEKDCEDCDGSGEVTWEYMQYEQYFECPVCDGSGIAEKGVSEPTGKKIPDENAQLKIGKSYFRMETISKLMVVCEIMGCDAELVSQEEEMKPSVFRIGSVEMLIMPVYSDCFGVKNEPFYYI